MAEPNEPRVCEPPPDEYTGPYTGDEGIAAWKLAEAFDRWERAVVKHDEPVVPLWEKVVQALEDWRNVQ
jgi:hypothetical protein